MTLLMCTNTEYVGIKSYGAVKKKTANFHNYILVHTLYIESWMIPKTYSTKLILKT